MALDRKYGNNANDAPGWDAFSVTPGASALSEPARALYVGASGDVEVTTAAGNDVTFANVPAGTVLPIRCTHVLTAASGSIVAFV